MSEIKQEAMEVSDVKKQKVRNYPMPKQINYYMLQNHGYDFYGSKVYSQKVKILHAIAQNLNIHGYNFSESEIERRLKNMKSHYRRKKEDIENGLVQKTDWEYYDLLHSIFSRIEQDNENKTPNFTEPIQEAPSVADYPMNEIPNAHQVKPHCSKVKQEKLEENETSDGSNEPLDMSAKKLKVIEFNNIKDVANQIAINPLPDNTNEEKKTAIKRVIDNLKVVDQARIALDEQRLKLEIRRNELDKLAYQLSDVLYTLINS